MIDNKSHWETVFTTKKEEEFSWYQKYPKTSMQLIEKLQLPLDSNIIDVGGGDSYLVDALLEKGYQNIWVLDISAAAIERAKARLGSRAELVHWVVSDITEFKPEVEYKLWHDRAAFHFLVTEEDRQKYLSIANKAICSNGFLVIGTFSDKGPKKCSGLEIRQYNVETISSMFNRFFERIDCFTEDHQTPFDTIQNFLFCTFKKVIRPQQVV